MNANFVSGFPEALQRCTTCGSQCTATLPATMLRQVVKEVVAELAPSGREDDTLPLACPPQTLLLILTYSYACGVLGSGQIAEELEDRADRCALVDQLAIGAWTLARFRRENHELLERCLAAVLKRLSTPNHQGPSPEADEVAATDERAVSVSPPTDPDGEAKRRIVLAAQTDSEERDL